jgi:hypothetical protein
MKEGDSVIPKVPQVICARKLGRPGKLVENEDYFNPKVFTKHFYEPAIRILGSNIEVSSLNRNTSWGMSVSIISL